MAVLVVILAYFLGSIPFGLLLTRAAGLGDIRAIGSGNIGATNVLRTGNKALAAGTLFLDGAKGAVAVLIAWHCRYPAAYYAGLAVFLGHLFPVWLGFKGGKGVATGLGVFLGASFLMGILACLSWVAVAVVSKYSSLAALVTFAVSPLLGFVFGGWRLALMSLMIAVLVFWKHRANMGRLRDGIEPRIGNKTA